MTDRHVVDMARALLDMREVEVTPASMFEAVEAVLDDLFAALDDEPWAIITVDGEEFIRCPRGDDYASAFDDTVARVGGEVSLMVYDPRAGFHVRQVTTVTAHKS
jgi:hypothetical protein